MRVTTKGQVTIPKDIRQRAGVHPGAEVEFVARGREIVMTRATGRRTQSGTDRDDFEAYLDGTTGVVDLGMTTDQFMELLRGE